MAAWWEFGDVRNEKAGFPALTPGDYDEATKTYDFLGFVTRKPLIQGGHEPRHVLIREIHSTRVFYGNGHELTDWPAAGLLAPSAPTLSSGSRSSSVPEWSSQRGTHHWSPRSHTRRRTCTWCWP